MQNTTGSIPSVSGELSNAGGDAVEMLTADHDVIKELLSELTAAGAPEQCRTVLERLKGVLTIHNATEENLVYPALAVIAGKKSESEHLFHETAEADTLVFELDTMLKNGGDASAVSEKAKKLRAAVLEHIDDEESKAFPHLQKHASSGEAQTLTDSVRRFRSALTYKT